MTPVQIQASIERGRGLVPDHLWPGLHDYFVDRVRPGDFLCALLANDLSGAVLRADPFSFAALPALARFVANFAPHASTGSRELVDRWLAGARSGR